MKHSGQARALESTEHFFLCKSAVQDHTAELDDWGDEKMIVTSPWTKSLLLACLATGLAAQKTPETAPLLTGPR
jgi:hypothetical protein